MTKAQSDLTAMLAAQAQGRFFGPQSPEAYDKPTNIVVAGNGIFRVVKTPVALFKAKVSEIPAAGRLPGLADMEEGPELLVPKIPLKYLIMALTWYRDVHTQDKTEASILFFWNHDSKPLPTHYAPTVAQKNLGQPGEEVAGLLEDGQLVIYCPQQKNSGTLSEFGEDGMVNYLRENCTALVETHSHHTMDAFFSGTDNANENMSQFYGVWGKINDEEPKFIFRWVCGDKKIIIDPSILFEIPQIEIKTTVTRTSPLDGVETIVSDKIEYETFKGPWARVEPPAEWMSQHSKSYYRAPVTYGNGYNNRGGATPSTTQGAQYGEYGYYYGAGAGNYEYGTARGGGRYQDKDDFKSDFESETQGLKKKSLSHLTINQEAKTEVEIFLEKNLDEGKTVVEIEDTVRFIIEELIGLGYDYVISDTITESLDEEKWLNTPGYDHI